MFSKALLLWGGGFFFGLYSVMRYRIIVTRLNRLIRTHADIEREKKHSFSLGCLPLNLLHISLSSLLLSQRALSLYPSLAPLSLSPSLEALALSPLCLWARDTHSHSLFYTFFQSFLVLLQASCYSLFYTLFQSFLVLLQASCYFREMAG